MTSSVNGVRLELQCHDKSFGETVALENGAELSFRADNTSPGTRLKLVTGEGTAVFDQRRNRSIGGSAVVKKPGFAYLLAVKMSLFKKETVCAISNPIYFE